MFRRKTDQIFDTLQAVQRRITEQGGAPPRPQVPTAPAVRPILSIGKARPSTDLPPPPPGPPPAAVRAAGPPPLSPPPAPPTLSPPSALARAATPGPYSPGQPAAPPPLITLTLSQVITVLIVLLVSHSVVWVFAARMSDSNPRSEPTPSGVGYRSQPTELPQSPRYIIVLTWAASSDESEVRRLKKNCDDLNAGMRKYLKDHPESPLRPWYSVKEHPSNGNTELIFGATENQIGIEKSPLWEDFIRKLAIPREQRGAGYSRASWRRAN